LSDTLRFASEDEAIEALRELTDARIIIAQGDQKGVMDRIKGWLKEKWTGFREVDLEGLSSAISMVRYNKKNKVLEIRFKQRGTYQYSGVPERTIEQFLSAKSKGKFFNKRIRNKYTYKRTASQNRRMRIAGQLSRSNYVGRMLAKQGMCKQYENINRRRLPGTC